MNIGESILIMVMDLNVYIVFLKHAEKLITCRDSGVELKYSGIQLFCNWKTGGVTDNKTVFRNIYQFRYRYVAGKSNTNFCKYLRRFAYNVYETRTCRLDTG